MHTKILAKGYTSAVLVLNMKRFVHPEDQPRFEALRGTDTLADALRHAWPNASRQQQLFSTRKTFRRRIYKDTYSPADDMPTEHVGFAMGVFRNLMLERYTFPTYTLDKSQIHFEEDLRTNFQFKTLFQRIWDRWEILIRPSFSGFFVIRLTQLYRTGGRDFKQLAQDVINLQESFDVPSAWNWLRRNRERYKNQPETLKEKERSIQALLRWLGADHDSAGEALYYPVQWKLAMEVAGWFVEHIGREIPVAGEDPIRLQKPQPSTSIPLHDSYLIHHFEELLAHPNLVPGKKKVENPNARIPVTVHDLRKSIFLRRALVNLVEGAILQPKQEDRAENTPPAGCEFPSPRWSITDNLMNENLATWNDEFCLLQARTAVILPAYKWKDHELSVSTMPGSTLRVRYSRYWGAIERMLEFVLEIRVLAQLVESVSYELLHEIVETVQQTREEITRGDIRLADDLSELLTQAAHLRRLASLVQRLNHAPMWSRAEYAIQKATHLAQELGIDETLKHIARNIDSINSVVDHVDEWYLADLAEKSNDQSNLFSFMLAAASLMLTLLMLPSFWADYSIVRGVEATELFGNALPSYVYQTGNIIAAFVIILSLALVVILFKQWRFAVAMLKALWSKEMKRR